MAHPNEELLRGAYGLRDRQEVSSLRETFHDDVVWHAQAGDLRGPDEVLEMLAGADEIAGGTTRREVHALFADDHYGIVLATVRAERPGRRYEDRHVHVYRFREGRVAEFWEYLQDPQGHEKFWS